MAKPVVPQVAIIILCWNNRDLLKECLDSTNSQTYPNCRVIMVDNGSSDDSVTYAKQHYPEVHVIENGQNLGFAIGNNIGIKDALANPDCEYIALLNTDATIDPDWVQKLVSFAQTKPKLASVQSPTVDYYDHRVLDSCGILIDRQALATQMGYRQTNVKLHTQQVFGVNAAAALFTRKFLEAQPFGEDYLDHDLWMYLEDVDLATRAVMMGWENWFLNESRAYHMGSASSGKNPSFSLYMTYRNNALVLLKNLPWRIIAKALPGLFSAEFQRLRGFWREGKYDLIKVIVKGRLVSIGRIPIFLRKRRQFKKYWNISEQRLWELMRLPKLEKIPPNERPAGSESVTVVILSRNNLGQLQSCIEAVQKQAHPNIDIIVVDNASTDGSIDFLERKFPNITLLSQKANLGTPNGFNIGITKALQDEPDYFVLLMAGTVMADDWLATMITTLRQNDEDVFAVTSKAIVASADGQPAIINQGRTYHPIKGSHVVELDGNEVQEVFASHNFATIYRADAIEAVGMMDGDFFEGLEDIDFCFRARLMGYTVLSQPAAVVHAVINPPAPLAAQWYHHQKNLFCIYVKDLPFKLFIKYLPSALWFTVQSYGRALAKGLLLAQLKALAKSLILIPRMLRYRRRINIRRQQRSVSVDKVMRQNLKDLSV